MDKKETVCLIPPDTRPHTLQLPCQIAKIAGLKVECPPDMALPNFNEPGNIKILHDWVKDTMVQESVRALVVSLETLTLGGMIPARRVNDSETEVLSRLRILKEIKEKNKSLIILAHGTIVRVAHGNDPYEEKEYYEKYGDLLREYSVWADKHSRKATSNTEKMLSDLIEKIPKDILSDYLNTRERNTQMHLEAINYLKEKVINYLAITLDDTAPYGLAAIDRRRLEKTIDAESLWDRADIYPGADELPSVLLARYLLQDSTQCKVQFVYNSVSGPFAEMIYEDRPLGEVLKCHARACGVKVVVDPTKADLIVAVNAPGKSQGEAFEQPDYEKVDTASRHLPEFIDQIKDFVLCKKPVMILDVAYANDCDTRFVDLLLRSCDYTQLIGISGWNTAGNSIGSGLALGVSYLKKKDELAWVLTSFTRLLDDYLYQPTVRQDISRALGNPSVFHLGAAYELAKKEIVTRLTPLVHALWNRTFKNKIDNKLEILKIYLPWPRLFSVTFDLILS